MERKITGELLQDYKRHLYEEEFMALTCVSALYNLCLRLKRFSLADGVILRYNRGDKNAQINCDHQ